MKHALPALLLALVTSACSLSGGEVEPDPPQAEFAVYYHPTHGNLTVVSEQAAGIRVEAHYSGDLGDFEPLAVSVPTADSGWLYDSGNHWFVLETAGVESTVDVWRVARPERVIVSVNGAEPTARCPGAMGVEWSECGSEERVEFVGVVR